MFGGIVYSIGSNLLTMGRIWTLLKFKCLEGTLFAEPGPTQVAQINEVDRSVLSCIPQRKGPKLPEARM